MPFPAGEGVEPLPLVVGEPVTDRPLVPCPMSEGHTLFDVADGHPGVTFACHVVAEQRVAVVPSGVDFVPHPAGDGFELGAVVVVEPAETDPTDMSGGPEDSRELTPHDTRSWHAVGVVPDQRTLLVGEERL